MVNKFNAPSDGDVGLTTYKKKLLKKRLFWLLSVSLPASVAGYYGFGDAGVVVVLVLSITIAYFLVSSSMSVGDKLWFF